MDWKFHAHCNCKVKNHGKSSTRIRWRCGNLATGDRLLRWNYWLICWESQEQKVICLAIAYTQFTIMIKIYRGLRRTAWRMLLLWLNSTFAFISWSWLSHTTSKNYSILAGFPKARLLAGIFSITTLPAPTVAPLPILTLPTMVE